MDNPRHAASHHQPTFERPDCAVPDGPLAPARLQGAIGEEPLCCQLYAEDLLTHLAVTLPPRMVPAAGQIARR